MSMTMEGEKEVGAEVVDETPAQVSTTPDPGEGDEAAAEQAEETGDSANPDGDDTAAPARKNRGVGKRINELVKEREDARREAAEKAAEADYWRKKAGDVPDEKAPTLEQFDHDYDKYQRALTKYEVRQELKAEREQAEQQKAEAAQHEAVTTFRGRIAEFEAEHPDFKEVAIESPLAVAYPAALVEAIRDLEDGPALAYHLGKNFDDAKLLIKLGETPNAAKAVKAISDYWAKVKPAQAGAAKSTIPDKPDKSVTKAPKVPATLDSGSGVQKDITKMSWAEFKAAREKEEAARKR